MNTTANPIAPKLAARLRLEQARNLIEVRATYLTHALVALENDDVTGALEALEYVMDLGRHDVREDAIDMALRAVIAVDA